MNSPVPPNDLDRAVMAMQRSSAAMPDLCRALCVGELWVLVPYHPELDDQDFELREGMPFPFVQLGGEHGLAVPVFSSEARVREGLRKGKVPPRTYMATAMPALQLLAILGKSEMQMSLNKSCATGEVTLPAELLRDLADGSALKPLGIGGGQREQLKLKILNPADYPTKLVQAAFDLFRKHANFRAAWIFINREPEQPPPALCTWYLLVLMDPRDEVIYHDFNLVVQSARGGHELSISLAKENNPADIANTFRLAKPFYVAADYRPPGLPADDGGVTPVSQP